MKKQNKTTDNLTDKAFSRLVLTSILGIFVCIVCLCSTTFAWFVESADSDGNKIKMAERCALTVTVTQDKTVLQNIESGIELKAGLEYTVTLVLPPNTSSGYCLITAGDSTYYTEYIQGHKDEGARKLSFKLMVKTTQEVTFISHWGIYARESDVGADGILLIP